MPDDRQCDAMRAQLVEAFMAGDTVRYREASAWLVDYVKQHKLRSGRVLINENWFDPTKRDLWRRALSIANQKRSALKRRAV